MAQILKQRRSSVEGKVPTTSDLSLGELAINTYDGRIFFEKNGGSAEITQILTANSQTTGSLELIGHISASGNISGSLTSTGSFGRIMAAGNSTLTGTLNTSGNATFNQNIVMQSNKKVGSTSEYFTMNSGNGTISLITGNTTVLHATHPVSGLRVGIGTTSPTEKLTVAGDISASGDFHGLDGTLTLGGNISGSATSTGSFSNIVTNTRGVYRFGVQALSNVTSNINTAGNDGEGGGILIENTHPSGRAVLRMRGGSGISHLVYGENNSTDEFNLSPRNQTQNVFKMDHNGDITVPGNITLPGTGTDAGNGNVSGSSTSTGSFGYGHFGSKLGIGTTAPSSPLHVKSSAADLMIIESDTLNREIIIKNTASTPSGILSSLRWLGNDSAGNSTIYAQISARVEDDTSGAEAGALAFWTNKNGTQSEKVRIDEDGFVGIGTTSPSAPLHVVGNITVTGTVDGIDIATRDAILTSTTTTAGAALPKAGGAMTGAITTNSTFDGVDIAVRDAILTSTTTTANSAVQPADTFYIGTTSIAHNRSSAALTLAGLTLTTPNLGTPSALVGTNISGTASSLTAGKTTVTDSTANTNFPIVFNNESDALLDDTGALRYNPSTGTLLAPNLVVAGTTTTVNTVTMNAQNAIVFEGATADDYETTLSIVDPTADRTQYLCNHDGYIALLAASTTTAITSTPAELNLLDTAVANTVVNSKAVIYGSSGELAGTLSTAAQTNITSVGTLQSPTIVTPTIASFANATHTHANAAGGGQITLGTGTTGNYVATAVAGDGIDVSGATGNVTITAEDSTASNKGIVIVAGGTGISVGYSGGTATVTGHTKYAITETFASGEVTQLQNIGATTISATQWGYLGAATGAITNTNTTYTGGTNLTLSGTTFNVDDAFLKNDANDTTSGTLTSAGFISSGNISGSALGTGSFGSLNLSGGQFTSQSLAAAAAGADNMGNHTATQNLNMNSKNIFALAHVTASGNISGSSTSTGSFGLMLQNGLTLATVGGSNTQVLFNDGGAISGDAGLIYNKTTNHLSGSADSTGSFGYVQIDTKLAIGTTDVPYGPLRTYTESGNAKQHFKLFPSDGLSGVQTNLATSFQIKAGTSATLHIDAGTDDNAGIEFKHSGSLGPYITAQHNFSLFDIGTRNGYDIRLRPHSGIVDFDDNSIKDLLHLSASGDISGSATSTGSFGYLNVSGDTVIGGNLTFGDADTDTIVFDAEISSSFVPDTDNMYDLGSPAKRWQDLYAVSTTVGGVFEVGLRSEGVKDLETGTVLVWSEDRCVPCIKNGDELVMGISRKGKDEPIVLGAEPILVTGKVDVGDYIITSKKIGHGKAVKRGLLIKKDLFGKVIAQALESGVGDSHTVKAMIRKM